MFFNHFTLSQNPYSQSINAILKEVKKLTESIVKTDTIEFIENNEGISGKLKFLDKSGNTIKIKTFFGGEHGSFTDNEYYSNGQLIYSTGESESWVGFYTAIGVSIEFYEKNKLFRIENLKENQLEKHS